MADDLNKLKSEHEDLKSRFSLLEQRFTSYRRLLGDPHTGFVLSNKKGQVVEIDPRLSAWLGYNPDEVIGTTITSLLHLDDHDSFLAKTIDSLQPGETHSYHARLIRKDEDVANAKISTSAHHDEDMDVFFTSWIHPVTGPDLLNIQTTAMEAAANGIVITDINGTIIWINPAYAKMSGYTYDELIGQNPRIVKSGRHDKDFYANLWGTIAAGQVWSGRLSNRKKNGELYYEEMTVTPVVDDAGHIINYVAIKEDVTDKYRIAEELSRTDERFRDRIQTIHGYIYDIEYENNEIVSVYHSPKCLDLTGYTDFEYGSNHNLWFDMVYSEDREKIREFVESKFSAERTISVEHRIITKEGKLRWVNNTTTLLRDEKGNIAREIGFVDDISARKYIEQELANYRQNLEEMVKDRTKKLNDSVMFNREFLSRVSHELRTPLNSIMVLSQGMVRKAEGHLSPKYLDYMRIIEKSGRRLLDMINEILEITRNENKAEQSKQTFTVEELIQTSLVSARTLADEKKLNIVVEVEPGMPAFKGDRDRIILAIENLVSNAVKYTNKGQISINCMIGGGELLITVVDTGIGISDQDQKRVFNEFYRSEKAYNSGEEGSGLGLAIASKYIHMMNGNITVTSRLDEGSRFSIHLPLTGAGSVVPVDNESLPVDKMIKQHETEPDHPHKESDPGKRLPENSIARILIVEDNPENFYTLKFLLQDTRCPIFQAETGRKALQLAKTLKPDIILLDINLPDISGIEVYDELQKTNPDTPVIAVTANADEADKKRVLDKGFAEYIVKPVDEDHFISVMENYLSKELT